MSEQNTPQPQKEKEIDLLEVTGKAFTGIKRGTKSLVNFATWLAHNLGQFLLQTIRYTIKHFWLLAVLAVLGAAFGFTKARVSRPFFATEMLVETQLIPRAQIAERINSLQQLANDQNHAALVRLLNIPIADAEALFFIRADVVNVVVDRPRRRVVEGDDVEVDAGRNILGPEFVRIRIKKWNNQGIQRLERALVMFIETDPYTQERLEIFRRNNRAQREAIETEIAQLRLFQQKSLENTTQTMATTIGNMPLVIQQNEDNTYVNEILSYQNRLLALDQAYELTRPLSVIQPFFLFENPVNVLIRNLLLFTALFLLAGYLTLLTLDGWKWLKPLL